MSKAVGREADGAKLIADTKALLTKTAADNASFKGRTFAIGNISGSDLAYFTKTDIRSQAAAAGGVRDQRLLREARERRLLRHPLGRAGRRARRRRAGLLR
ncbi:hypothetical protein GCM10025868_15710 [Angustibacter aerolatus]|uniref:Uncharacterized protein n=1 Tax=Angustibacter aerolatus TaxID=1162965 RepID=A0ABQ6JDR1_9ACTN|nr:hypothetical protein GCM10025868_15710 [Angustibacter aerolatus]